jgi:hypothetical protein
MMKSGMETGMNQSYAALDKVLASPETGEPAHLALVCTAIAGEEKI